MKKRKPPFKRKQIKKLLTSSIMALGVAGGMASGAPILQIKGQAGQSLVSFDADFLDALADMGIELDAVSPGKEKSKNRGITLPVSGGVVDLDGFIGEINLAGGLIFTDTLADGTKIKFHNLTLELFEGQPVVTGVVQLNGALVGTMPLFNIIIDGDSEIFTQRNGKLKTKNLGLVFTEEALLFLEAELGLTPGNEEVAEIGGGAKMRSFKPQYADDDDSDDDSSDDDSSDDDSSDDDSSDDDSSDDESSDDESSDDESSDDDSSDDESSDDLS